MTLYMKKNLTILLLSTIAFFLAVPPKATVFSSGFGVERAHAQTKKKNLFQILFERSKKRRQKQRAMRKRKKVVKRKSVFNAPQRTQKKKTISAPSKPARKKKIRNKRVKKTSTRRRQVTTAAAATTAIAATAASSANNSSAQAETKPTKPAMKVEKSETATKILVIGDFIADRVANGLTTAAKSDPDVIFVDKAVGNSGLVRADVKDWPNSVEALIEEYQPKTVVISVGMNDRQMLRNDKGKLQKLSDEWRAEYSSRVQALITNVRKRNIQLVWVGLPPVRFRSMNNDYLVFNEIFRSRTEAAGGKFVDIWDGFTDDEGNFSAAGPDVNGRIVRLRLNDGINFTKAGRLKLAFYTQKDIRQLSGLGSAPALEIPAPAAISSNIRPRGPILTGITPTLSLDSALLDGGNQLEGSGDFLNGNDTISQSGSSNLVIEGKAVDPHKGRIDAAWGTPVGGLKIDDQKADSGKADPANVIIPEKAKR